MKKSLPLFVVLVASVSVLMAQPSQFDFTPNNAFGTVIAAVHINGEPASVEDYIAAFDEDRNCAGAAELFDYNGQTFCTLLVYGNDVTTPNEDEGIDTGETFTFRLWVKAIGEILDHPMDIEPVEGWDTDLNGAQLPGWDFADGKVVNFDISTTYAPTTANYDDAINVFPNPVIDKANIIYKLAKPDNVTVALLDLTGKQVITLVENQTLQASKHIIELNINNLASDIYYLKVKGKESNVIRKLMIIK